MQPDSPSPSSRLQQQQRQELHTGDLARQMQASLEFATAEDLLRHDRAATPLPEAIETRLRESLAAEPPPRPWWKRLLGK